MNCTLFFTLIALFCTGSTGTAGSANALPPTHPCDIIDIASRLTIPRLDFREQTTLKEALTFIYAKYRDIDVDPPRSTIFVFEFRLPETTLQRHVSFQARNVTMIQGLKLALAEVPVALTFEPGKVIFSSPSSSVESPPSIHQP